jgi:hypothetical protein
MIARLDDQKKLLAEPNFVRTVKRWERKEGGEKVLVERPLRTSKWWQPDQSGGYVMTVKVGSKRIEFEKGKAAIAVGLTCPCVFPPDGVRVRPEEGRTDEASKVHGRADYRGVEGA